MKLRPTKRHKRVDIEAGDLYSFFDIHPTLLKVMADVIDSWPVYKLTVTDFNRTWEEDSKLGASGIHACGPPWRALDLRIRDIPGEFLEIAEMVASEVNEGWVYDPLRRGYKVCLVEADPPHMHVQVHPNTIRKENDEDGEA